MHAQQETAEGQALRAAVGMRDICDVFGISDELDAELAARAQRALELGMTAESAGIRSSATGERWCFFPLESE